MSADWALRELRVVAAAFLKGEMSPLEAAIACPHIELSDAPPALHRALNTIVGVCSETDDIPVGARRELWHPDVREREDAKHDHAQAWARPLMEEACQQILDTVPVD